MRHVYSLIFILAFLSISFCSLIWVLPLSISAQKINALSTRPIIFDSNLIFTSQEGFVYSVSPTSGKSLWSKYIGGYPRQPVIFSDTVIVASSNGNVIAYKKDGIIKWNTSLDSYVFGLTSADKIYATTKKGIYSLDTAGNKELLYQVSDVTYTPPVSDGKRIIFGYNDSLVSIKPNKQVEWAVPVSGVWKSAPVIDSGMVFVGSLDKNLYAFDAVDGFYRWKVETRGWILSTPYVYEGTVYFGSNDGYAYAVEQSTGKLKWKLQTKDAVQSTPTVGSFGGKKVVFVGSNDNNLYAIDDATGDLLWKQAAKDWVGSPFLIGRSVIFGSYDGRIYSVSTERACTFESPDPGTAVGYKEVPITGKIFSEYGNPQVYVRINRGLWQEIPVVNETWTYFLDPMLYEFGIVEIDCKIRDSLGEEGDPYSVLTIVRSENLPKEKLNVVFPDNVREGESFNIYVIDSNKEPVNNFEVNFQGKTYKGNNGTATITSVAGGNAQELIVSKPGYENPNPPRITVSTSTQLVWAVIGVVLIIGVIAFIYYKVIMKK